MALSSPNSTGKLLAFFLHSFDVFFHIISLLADVINIQYIYGIEILARTNIQHVSADLILWLDQADV